jgi:hypothetical protein
MAWKDPKARERLEKAEKRRTRRAAWRKEYNQLRVARVKLYLIELKSQPCTDCGVRYPHYVMDFDHVRGEKVAGLSDLLKVGDLARVKAEVLKCELVCSNCHRQRTWDRMQRG